MFQMYKKAYFSQILCKMWLHPFWLQTKCFGMGRQTAQISATREICARAKKNL
jgi:hypothetical protein